MLALTPPPRGLRHYEQAAPRVLSGWLLMAALSAYLFWQQIWLFRGWSNLFSGLGRWFGLDVGVALSFENGLFTSVSLKGQVPTVAEGSVWLLAIALAMFAGSWMVNAQRVPARYGLRALALVLALPALGFLALGHRPDLDAEAHVAHVFKVGYWFLLLLPIIYGMTAFTLPGNLGRRTLGVLMAMLYFYYSVPVLALVHWQLLMWLGEAAAAPLNVLLTVLLMSVHMMAFYGLLAAVEE